MSGAIAVTVRDDHTPHFSHHGFWNWFVVHLVCCRTPAHSSQVTNLSTTRACRILVRIVCFHVTSFAATQTSFWVLGLSPAFTLFSVALTFTFALLGFSNRQTPCGHVATLARPTEAKRINERIVGTKMRPARSVTHSPMSLHQCPSAAATVDGTSWPDISQFASESLATTAVLAAPSGSPGLSDQVVPCKSTDRQLLKCLRTRRISGQYRDFF